MKTAIKFIVLFTFVFLTTTICIAQTTQENTNRYAIYPAIRNTIAPGTIIAELKPGSSYEDYVIAINESDVPLTLDLYPADETVTREGKKAFKNQNDPQYNIGAWTKIEKNAVTLEPGQKEKVKFIINVPADAELKEYYGGIALRKKNTNENNIERGIIFSTRVIQDIALRVTNTPQEIPKVMQANIFNSTTPYFWISIGIFAASMAYFIYAKKSEKNAKPKESQKE